MQGRQCLGGMLVAIVVDMSEHAFEWNGKRIVAASYGGRWHLIVEGRSILGPPMVPGRPWTREEQVLKLWLDLSFDDLLGEDD